MVNIQEINQVDFKYKSLSMKQETPSYIIKYIECTKEGHQGQKVNLICLNPQCHEQALICSLCTPQHRGHTYKPIKIYLDELHHRYRQGANQQKQDIDELQKRKLLLLHHLRVCVERISEEFMKLEEDILLTYERIKNQIHQNESRKSKFAQFYLSMIKDNYGDPHFQVKNYLYKEEIKILTDQDIFDNLVKAVEKEVKSVRANFINAQAIEKNEKNEKNELKIKQDEGQKGQYLLPANIVKANDLFSQTLFPFNNPNMCLFNFDIGQWMGKLRVVITSLSDGAKVSFGLIRKQEFDKANNKFSDLLNCMYVDSVGKCKGVQYNHIGGLAVNSMIDCFLKKNNFRITSKNNHAIMNLTDKNYCFFFALEGNCSIKVTYPHSNK